MASITRNTKKAIKLNAKALYIIDGLDAVWDYLTSKIDDGSITENEAGNMVEAISTECARVTVGQSDHIMNMIQSLGK